MDIGLPLVLPENPYSVVLFPYLNSNDIEVGRKAYIKAQQDMLNAGYRQVLSEAKLAALIEEEALTGTYREIAKALRRRQLEGE